MDNFDKIFYSGVVGLAIGFMIIFYKIIKTIKIGDGIIKEENKTFGIVNTKMTLNQFCCIHIFKPKVPNSIPNLKKK